MDWLTAPSHQVGLLLRKAQSESDGRWLSDEEWEDLRLRVLDEFRPAVQMREEAEVFHGEHFTFLVTPAQEGTEDGVRMKVLWVSEVWALTPTLQLILKLLFRGLLDDVPTPAADGAVELRIEGDLHPCPGRRGVPPWRCQVRELPPRDVLLASIYEKPLPEDDDFQRRLFELLNRINASHEIGSVYVMPESRKLVSRHPLLTEAEERYDTLEVQFGGFRYHLGSFAALSVGVEELRRGASGEAAYDEATRVLQDLASSYLAGEQELAGGRFVTN